MTKRGVDRFINAGIATGICVCFSFFAIKASKNYTDRKFDEAIFIISKKIDTIIDSQNQIITTLQSKNKLEINE